MPATETVTEKPDVGRLLHRLANRVDRFARGGLLAVIEAAASATAVDPSDAQREAGNYRKGRVTLHGLPITIETPKGAIRRGVNSEGDTWEVEMPHHYGYFRLTESEADGDHVDCFIGPNPKSEIAFIIDQCTPGGHFDEHKVMLGWTNAEAAKAAYLSAYSDDWEGFDGIQAMTVEQLAEWLKKGDTSKRVARYAQWNESQHPRANDGKFGEGGGDSAPNRETQKTATDLADGIEAANPGLKLDLFDKSKLYGDRKVWELARIVVPKTARGSGLGSTVMQQITAAADRAGATITLDPSTDFGASSKARLIDFYRRFGFVPNKGRGADLSLSGAMVRLPQTPRIDHARPTRGLTVREALERIDYKKHKPAAGQKSIEWDEDKHPRADDGKFGSGPGSSAPNKVTEKTAEAEPDQNNETPEQKTERIRREAAEEYKREGVRSKFFKQWFGDWEHDQQNASKVVDEDGKPKETTGIDGEGSKVMKDGKPVTVYHGTKFGGFNEFQRKKLKDPDELLFGQGFYFTEDDTVADQYAGRTEYHAANGFDTKEDAQEWINFKAKSTRDSFKSTLDDITFKVAVDKQNPSKFAVRLFGYEKASNVLNRELGDADIGKARSFLAEQDWMGGGEDRKGNEEMAKAIANTAWDAAMVTKSGVDGMRELNTLLRDPQTYWVNKRQQMPYFVPYTATPEFLKHVDKLREAVGVQSIPPSREVKKIFLNIRKPLDMDKPISSKKPYADAARRIASDVLRVNKIAAKPGKFAPYKDAAGLRDSLNQWADSASQKVVGLPNDTETGESVYSFLTQMLGKAAAEHVIREAGHDGITHIGGHRMGGGHEHRVWIAFEPTQIKSTDNAGTFDPSQPRVDYKKHKPAPGQSTLWDESAHPRDDDGKFGSGSGGSAPVKEVDGPVIGDELFTLDDIQQSENYAPIAQWQGLQAEIAKRAGWTESDYQAAEADIATRVEKKAADLKASGFDPPGTWRDFENSLYETTKRREIPERTRKFAEDKKKGELAIATERLRAVSRAVSAIKKAAREKEQADIERRAQELYKAGVSDYGYAAREEARKAEWAEYEKHTAEVSEKIKKYGEHQAKYINGLPQHLQTAITQYTAGSSSTVNNALRKCPENFDCIHEDYREQTKKLSSELREALAGAPPLPAGTEVYRGVSFGDITEAKQAEFLSNFRPGRTLSLGGFSSTSLDYKTAQGFGGEIMLKIKAKRGLYVGGVSSYKHDEREVLQQEGTRYRVAGQGLNKELARYVIELEEI